MYSVSHGEYVYVFLPDGVFLPCDHGRLNFDISLSMWDFNQPIKTFSVNTISVFGDDLSLCSTSIFPFYYQKPAWCVDSIEYR